MNKKIFYISDEVLIENNAPTLHIVEVCNELQKIGYGIKIFTPSLSSTKKINKHVALKKVYTSQKLKSLFFHPLLACLLICEFMYKTPDLVYIRYFPLLVLPILISKFFNIPCVIEVNGKLVDETLFTNKYILAKIYKILGTINMKNASSIITVTSGIKNYLINTYNIEGQKISVVSNGVNLRMYKPTSIIKARKKTKLSQKDFYVGYVGSLYKYQGLNYVITAIKKLSLKFPSIKFIIVGNGPNEEKQKLISQIDKMALSKNVKIVDAIAHDRVPDYINSFNVCVCYPTKFRDNATSPFKLYEYLLFSKPVICSDLGGIRENFKDILLYSKAENPTDLSQKILYLYKNHQFRNNLGSKGNKIITKNHSWSSVAQNINTILTQEIRKYEN